MHTLGLGPSIVMRAVIEKSSRNYIVDYLASVNGYDNTLVSPPAFYVDGQGTRLPHPKQGGMGEQALPSGSGAEAHAAALQLSHFLSPKTDIA